MATNARRRSAFGAVLAVGTALPLGITQGCNDIATMFDGIDPSDPSAEPFLIVQPATASPAPASPQQPISFADGIIVNIQAGNAPTTTTPYLAIRVQGGTFSTTDTDGLTVACVPLPLVPGESFGLYQIGVLPGTREANGTEALLHVGLAIDVEPCVDAAAQDGAENLQDAVVPNNADADAQADSGDAGVDAGQDAGTPDAGAAAPPQRGTSDPYLDQICRGATLIAERLVPIDSNSALPIDAGPDSTATPPPDATTDAEGTILDASTETSPQGSDGSEGSASDAAIDADANDGEAD